MNLTDLLDRRTRQPLLVLGDLMLDHWVWGSVSRISPEAPIPVVDVERYTYTAGGAANVVTNLRALDVPVELFGVIGRDDSGGRLKRQLAQEGASVDGIVADPDRPTTLKTRIVAHSQQLVRADYESRAPLSEELQAQLLERLAERLKPGRLLLLSDYDKGLFQPRLLEQLRSLVKERGARVIAGPKPANFATFKGVELVSLNAREAALSSGLPASQLESTGDALRTLLPGASVLVTRGEHGMTLFSAEGAQHHVPALATQVFDVSGAGDTVLATVGWTLACGARPEEAIRVASVAAAVVVRKVGTAVASAEEIQQGWSSLS